MLKKLLTLCLALLVLSLPASAMLVDIGGEAYEEEIALLYDLGIVEGKEADLFMPNDNLTRAEMATIVLRLLGTTGNVPAAFTDVPAEHWASLIIGTAAQMQIVNGVSETEFAPEEAVTYPQAVKMLVCALGYDVQARSMGGYPTGHLSKASQLGVLDGTADSGSAISRGTMAKLVANALEVSVFVRTAYCDAYTFAEKEGATLLNSYMDIEVIKGKVTANSMLNLGGASARAGQFSIGDITIEEGTTFGGKYIGRTVTAYVREENDVYTALHVAPKYKDGYKEVDASDILPASTLTLLQYEEENKAIKAEISSSATWIYNGVVKRDMTPAELIFDIGNVALISENGEAAETVFVYSYKNLIVDTVRTDLHKVTFKNPSEGMSALVLDPNDASVRYNMIDNRGTEVKLEELAEWDVLSVAKNGNVYRIIRENRVVSGKVTELGEKEAVIGDERYEIAANVDRNSEITAPAIDMEANFYLDFTGKIAAADTENFKEYKYAYLVSVFKEKGISGIETVKMFTEDNEMKIFTLSDNFKLNNTPADTLVTEAGNAVYTGSATKRQLVRFKANASDELLMLETALDIKDNRDSYTTEQRTARFTEERFYTSGGLYGPPARMYEFKFLVREKTKVFRVPETYTGNDTLFSMIDPMSIGHLSTWGTLPNLTLFDVDEESVISAMVTVDSASGSVEQMGVIANVSKTLNGEGETLNSLKLLTDNGEVSITISETADISLWTSFNSRGQVLDGETANAAPRLTFADLSVGDVIWYSSPNTVGETGTIHVVHQMGVTPANRKTFDSGNDTTATAGPYPGFILTYGPVVETSQYGATVQYPLNVDGTGGNTTSILSYESVKGVYLYDTVRKTFSEITTAEIYEQDMMFSYRNNLQERLFVVYR